VKRRIASYHVCVAEARQNNDGYIAALRLKFAPQFLGFEKFVGSAHIDTDRSGDCANVRPKGTSAAGGFAVPKMINPATPMTQSIRESRTRMRMRFILSIITKQAQKEL
jgi:hypothetical protein